MSLFQVGEFRLSSGGMSDWIIDCRALSASDWDALAVMSLPFLPHFGEVVGVPRGGLPFADALRRYATQGRRLLVDDVWTTGRSISRMRSPGDLCWVAFAREPPTDGAGALFTMPERLCASQHGEVQPGSCDEPRRD